MQNVTKIVLCLGIITIAVKTLFLKDVSLELGFLVMISITQIFLMLKK